MTVGSLQSLACSANFLVNFRSVQAMFPCLTVITLVCRIKLISFPPLLKQSLPGTITGLLIDCLVLESVSMLPDGPSNMGGGTQGTEGKEDASVTLFREYLRLKTVHPEPDYGSILF